MASITKRTTELKETTSYDKKLITCLNCVQIGPETDALHEHLRGRFAKKKQSRGKVSVPSLRQFTRSIAINSETPRSSKLSKSKERRNKTRSINRGRRIREERNFSDQFERI